jgi:hypothetical protein
MALAVIPKFTWQTIILKLPAGSRYFGHDECAGACMRGDGSQLRPSTISHVCMVIADRVRESDPDSRAYLSIKGLAHASKRNRHTIIMAISHLRVVGLLDRARRGGDIGVARKAPSIYCLTIPDAQLLKLAGIDPAIMARVTEDLAERNRPEPGPYSWWERERATATDH